MKTKALLYIFLALVLGGCAKKDDTEQIRQFKENVYCYMFASQSVAVYISDNIKDYERGLHYLDMTTGNMNGSYGEYCYEVKDMVRLVRAFYKALKANDVIASYKADAKRTLPPDHPDLEKLYKIAEDMEGLALTSELTHTYPNKYQLLLEQFTDNFSATDQKYPNTNVDYEQAKATMSKMQEVLMNTAQ